MSKSVGYLIVGIVLGMVLMGVILIQMMPTMMLTVHKSSLDFEETVTAIEEAAIARGWLVPKIYNIQKNIVKAGHEDMTRVKVISMCQPDHAYNVLKEDSNKKMTAMMPCRLGIYETENGEVMIAGMNVGLISRLFGGTISEVMGEVAKEGDAILQNIIVQ